MTMTWTLVTSGNASTLSRLKVWIPNRMKPTHTTSTATRRRTANSMRCSSMGYGVSRGRCLPRNEKKQARMVSMRHYQRIHVERSGARQKITLAYPKRRNALGPQMTNELLWALEDARTDESVRVIILTGEGSTFSAGGDFAQMGP